MLSLYHLFQCHMKYYLNHSWPLSQLSWFIILSKMFLMNSVAIYYFCGVCCYSTWLLFPCSNHWLHCSEFCYVVLSCPYLMFNLFDYIYDIRKSNMHFHIMYQGKQQTSINHSLDGEKRKLISSAYRIQRLHIFFLTSYLYNPVLARVE